MKRGRLAIQFILLFSLVLIGYVLVFGWIERQRIVKGPWVIDFSEQAGVAALTIQQPTLGITNVQIRFAGAARMTNSPQRFEFALARQVPFELPFGKCIFQDTTFLPGTIVLQIQGHEIQLLPRALTIDKVERSWRNGEAIELK